MAGNNQIGELRLCHVTGKWVLVPPPDRRERGKVKNLLTRETRQTFRSMRRGDCPFCPGWFNKNYPPVDKYDGRFQSERAGNVPVDGGEPGILEQDAGVATDWNKSRWDVFAIKNKQPLLPYVDPIHQPVRGGAALFQRIDGIGFSEVVVENPGKHQVPAGSLRGRCARLKKQEIVQIRDQALPWDAHPPLGILNDEKCERLLSVLQRRFHEIREDKRIRYVSIFRNHGPESGATLEHPHCQIVASPIVPAQVANEVKSAYGHFESVGGRCVVCEMLEGELARHKRLEQRGEFNKTRVLYRSADDQFVAIHPYASTVPFETWIIPRVHDSSIDHDDFHNRIRPLAHVLTWTLGRLYMCLDNPAYNMVFKMAPIPAPKEEPKKKFDFYHWHIVIQPQRLLIPGGYEMSTGITVNPTPPESESSGGSDKYDGMGSVEFIQKRGFLFEDDPTLPGALRWYRQPPTDDEKDLKITLSWESKQRTLRNIVTILEREQCTLKDGRLTGAENGIFEEVKKSYDPEQFD